MATPLLGWIPPKDRTPAMTRAHENAVNGMQRIALGVPKDVPKKIMLSDFASDPRVIKDTGVKLDRTPGLQNTGSCVGVGWFNCVYYLLAVQRCLSHGATRAYLPWWPFSYGRGRALGGMHGEGEGSFGSVQAQTVRDEGVLPLSSKGLPTYTLSDGLQISARMEMQWSNGDSKLVRDYLDEAREYPVKGVAEIRDKEEVIAAVTNGYPGTFACSRFISSATVRGTGKNAACVGKWDRNGGHQQFWLAYWLNEELGPLYGVGNNWPRDTYPADPGGLPLCACWVLEKDFVDAFRYDAEVYAFSHATWFPAQPEVRDWAELI